jgi:levanase
MSVPRELGLRTVDGQLRLVQQPVRELRSLRARPAYVQAFPRRIPAGTTALPARGKALEIYATLRLGTAQQAGLNVRTGDGEHTAIGYDATTGEVYVDRTQSGQTAFNPDFPGVQRAPLAARHGTVRLHILVDWSSVEVFADHGARVITDQIFPSAASDGLQLFANGGSATLDSLAVIPLRSSWTGERS